MSRQEEYSKMTPEELARAKIDKQLNKAGWNIVSRNEYIPDTASAVKEALMQGNTESDYLLFVDNKAIAVVEAKREENPLAGDVAIQAEEYALAPQSWYGLWFSSKIPLVYLANGNKIYFKNLLTDPNGDYQEIPEMHTPKKMLQLIGEKSEYGALPMIVRDGLRDCQYRAEVKLEESLKAGKKKALAILATGSGKTYLACLASYRLLNYTDVKRVLFLVDRNNLARQTETEYSTFDRTATGMPMNAMYQINRLKKAEDIKGDIVISTIQKLFAVLTGQTITDTEEDAEDEANQRDNDKKAKEVITLDGNLTLPPNYFQLIIVDECHRSIYGKWQAVLNYFSGAKILGLTATPTEEAYAFFNKNIIEKYTYEDSVVDGVNVPSRVYRIKTNATEHGGTIHEGEEVTERGKKSDIKETFTAPTRIDYAPNDLDRSVVNKNQIELVLKTYRDAIYTDLYPDREENWAYIPKTLIFAKDDNHATQIVKAVKEVFKEKFSNGCVPEQFVQKITYSAGDSNALINSLRFDKEFRIAVTVTLVATGTDVKPLEVVLFMNDVKSDTLYTQMKGRGCRRIDEDKLKEVTPNAQTKDCFYIVDAVGVTESDKTIVKMREAGERPISLEHLIEHIAHGELSDDNLKLLRDYCSTIHSRYENSILFGRHLDSFINNFGFAPRTLANEINEALSGDILPPYESPSLDNGERKELVSKLITNLDARKQLLQMQKGYIAYAPDSPDEVIYAGFSKETARSFIDSFEKYVNDNKDSVEALRIIYNSEDIAITHSMLVDLQDKLSLANRQFTPYRLWTNYKLLDNDNQVERPDIKHNINALTHLIQLIRFAYKKSAQLTSLYGTYLQKFNLYCGQAQRTLTAEQREIMKQIADYVVGEGAITPIELNSIDTDLWRKGITKFGAQSLTIEMQKLAKFILKAA
jgi:type I restriction enzyme R subunit